MANIVISRGPLKEDVSKEYCCCPAAHCDLTEDQAIICLVLAILSPGLNTLVASIMDRKGCNMNTFFLGWLHGLLSLLCGLGYFLSIHHSYVNYRIAKR